MALIVILSFAVSLMPAFAAEKSDPASSKAATDKAPSFFQQASDDISKITLKVSDKSATEIFQESVDDIKAGCPDVRAESLRGHKSELKKRRVGKNIIFTT